MVKLKNLKIEEKAFNELKKYCDIKGFKMYRLVTEIISKKLNQEKENDNLQNYKSN